jgi:signal transduction histidine kinase
LTSHGSRVWLPGVALAGVAVALASTGSEPNRAWVTALSGLGVLLVWAITIAVRTRYPDRPMWIPLCVATVFYALQPAIYSTDPWLFAIGRFARPAMELVLVWTMLAFPTGTVHGRWERLVLGIGVATFFVLWLPGVLLAPQVPTIGAAQACGDGCPENVLSLFAAPEVSEVFLSAFRVVGVALMIATSALLVRRWIGATRLMRRALAPVIVVSLVRVATVAVFLSVGMGIIARTISLWAVPVGILLGLLLGRLYTARALHRLVTGLRRPPSHAVFRNVMADALEDPSLRVGFWHHASQRWRDADGAQIPLDAGAQIGPRATRVLRDDADEPVALLEFDPALLEEPNLLDAVVSSMEGALASAQMQSRLVQEREHSVNAVEAERRRIERDLHDGAQQRLIAMRMKVSVMQRLMDNNPQRARDLMHEMDGDIEAALSEMRTLAHGDAPPALQDRGLASALRELAARASLPVQCEINDQAPEAHAGVREGDARTPEIGRLTPTIERAVYFCCAEAIQNAAKHAGSGAAVSLSLSLAANFDANPTRGQRTLCFRIADNGVGLQRHGSDGSGMENMRARIASVGGTFEVSSPAAGGVIVSGRVPI